ncbi:MAG: DUF2892 domain-containing protein [Dokdonella sp.]
MICHCLHEPLPHGRCGETGADNRIADRIERRVARDGVDSEAPWSLDRRVRSPVFVRADQRYPQNTIHHATEQGKRHAQERRFVGLRHSCDPGVALIGTSLFGIIGPWGWIGIVPLATGLIRVCPACLPFGLGTCATKPSSTSP